MRDFYEKAVLRLFAWWSRIPPAGETSHERARQAEADANAATLDNVRTRWLRAAKAWDEMATRAEKTAERRSVNEEAKMLAEMMADD